MNTVTEKERKWPEDIQCAVNFGIDVDGETLWTSRDADNWNRPANLAQGSYGPRMGVPKILNVLDKHDVKATFFIPAWIIEKYPEMAREVIERGHEVGYHGYLHEFDMTAGYEVEKEIMDKSLDIFERILKVRPRGLRSPMGEMTDATMRLMQEYEFLYSSTMMDDDFPTSGSIKEKPPTSSNYRSNGCGMTAHTSSLPYQTRYGGGSQLLQRFSRYGGVNSMGYSNMAQSSIWSYTLR
jgi:peptidoglycan/xylan/chitin deacetylase (PgdA/CDA1 family)